MSGTRADVIVVLGCNPGDSIRAGAALVRRAERAALAFQEHGSKAIIASGGRRWRGAAEADLLSERLVALGVPKEVVVRELHSWSTIENARYSAELLRQGGYTNPAIVTCDWHMPRALACFRWVGVDAVGIPAPAPRRTLRTRVVDFLVERAKSILDRGVAATFTRRSSAGTTSASSGPHT